MLQSYIGSLAEWLDQQVDRRLVCTFFLALVAIARLRHSRSGLLLSELGAHIPSPAQAPAGTKRLSNRLRSPKWSHTLLERFLWHRADKELTEQEERGELSLAIWDESVLEKPESIALEGLCTVRSSKVVRLKRIKPGYCHRREALLYSSQACSGSPSCWPVCRDLLSWPSCAGGPAGASWPASGGMRPHPCSPSAPEAGKGGCYTFSTEDSPVRPGSGNWAPTNRVSSCAVPPATGWLTARVSVPLGRSPGANAPRATARLGPAPPPVPQDRNRGGTGPSSRGGG